MTPQPPSVAYVDASALVPLALDEQPVGDAVERRLQRHTILLSANLLEAELRVAFRHEQKDFNPAVLSNAVQHRMGDARPPAGR